MDQTTDTQINSTDFQSLLEYLSNVSSFMLDINKDLIYKEFQKQNNLDLIKYFSSDRNAKLLCVTRIDQDISEGSTKTTEILLETDLQYKGVKTVSICFIKKENTTL